ncbi:hypothetical protein [Streptococcus uberis]|uniref:hypothetical protein n=1 Tax=Streptococcus uberis TaxID=1349 RepID=UPI00062028A8|nr:hypothetical protein [Streptococcus uberis]KKF41465.1 hypothetical protein AF61_01915 [Streptococcus uberis EF20/0145]QBX12094.1 hypothetical protein JavanS634_0001 [Streptococcus satellite phage Javan634]
MTKEFSISTELYIKNIIKLIQERLSPNSVYDCIDIVTTTKSNRKVIDSVILKISDKKFKNFEDSGYYIKLSEKITPKTNKTVQTGKYSYEIKNSKDPSDFVRFDYKPYDNYPNFHINADEALWGNHLTFPETTNLNLEKLDCFKAINIFNAFVAHPEEHILDKTKNDRYKRIIEN